MCEADKRTLEILFHHMYLWYTTNNTGHNYTHFLQLPYLMQTNRTYDPEIIEFEWKNYLIANPSPPNETESMIAIARDSKILRTSKNMFAPHYKLKGIDRRVKLLSFRNLKLKLKPKIENNRFHDNLLEYFKQVNYMYKSLRGIIDVL